MFDGDTVIKLVYREAATKNPLGLLVAEERIQRKSKGLGGCNHLYPR